MTFGVRIGQLRTERGWSQRILADKVDVTQGSIHRYETSRTLPRIDTLARLSRAFGMTINELLEGVEFSC
jgi:transcriptional regulator with XRE-family HTH domain